jgi:hypothetical protein
MLRALKDLKGYRIEATDGELGSVRDILFDDEQWTVRYMVAATGPWLLGRRVLLGWPALGQPDWAQRTFPVSLTKQQVKQSPHVSVDEPVSRRHERDLQAHYGWRPYWGVVMAKAALRQAGVEPQASSAPADPDEETHLRSVREVVGYEVHTKDQHIGTVSDFFADDQSWMIRKVLVDIGTLLAAREILLDASLIEDVDWNRRLVRLGVETAELERAAG